MSFKVKNMTRFICMVLMLACIATGCRKASNSNPPANNTPANPGEAYAKKIPVIDRTLAMNDLKNLHLALRSYYDGGGGGKWPKNKEELLYILKQDPDLRKLIPKVEDGTYVVILPPPDGGILAHTGGEAMYGVVTITTGGETRNMTAGEFREALAQQKR
jgi:hypothetical protein